jgi:hypothetical protein
MTNAGVGSSNITSTILRNDAGHTAGGPIGELCQSVDAMSARLVLGARVKRNPEEGCRG